MNSNSHSLPGRRFVCEMQHKHAVGDEVRVIAPFSKRYLYSGIIHALIPFTFAAPGYYVKFGEDIVAESERSLEKIDVQDSDAG